MKSRQMNWLECIILAAAIVGLLMSPVLICAASPSIEVAVSTSLIRAAQKRFPELPDDFANPTGPRGGLLHGVPPTVTPPSRGLRLEIDPTAVVAANGAILIHSAPWCGPCVSMKKDVGAGDATQPVEWTDDPIPAAIVAAERAQGREAAIPCSTWIGGNGRLQYLIGRYTLAQLKSSHSKTNPPHEAKSDRGSTRAVETAGSRATDGIRAAGVLHGREVIRSVLEKWRDVVGVGNKVTGTWMKSGGQNYDVFSLLRGKPWPTRDIYGDRGSFSISAPTTNWMAKEASFDYRVIDNDVRFNIEFMIEASRLGITDNAQAVGSATPVGVSPLMILSGLSMLWQMAHPELSVILPGTIQVEVVMNDDGALRVAFASGKAPSVRAKMLWEFMLGIQSVEISEAQVRIVFVPQPHSWVKIPGWTFKVQ